MAKVDLKKGARTQKSAASESQSQDTATDDVPDESGPAKPVSSNSAEPKTDESPGLAKELSEEVNDEGPPSFEELELKLLRLRAEYDNYRKRTNREKSELLVYAGSHFIIKMFPIIDDLTRTYEHGIKDSDRADKPVLKGLKMILDNFRKTLKEEGVEEINAVGQPFDTNLHDALMSRASEEHEAGIVLEQFEAGYIYNERVLKHAKVIVSS